MSALWWAEARVARAARILEALLPKRTGKKERGLSVKGLLVGLFLVAEAGQPLHLTRVTKVLNNLCRADRRRLGVPKDVTYRQVERLFNAINNLIDPEPVRVRRGRRRIPVRHAAADDRQALQDEINDTLLEATIPSERKRHGSYAIDGTDVETWAKGSTPSRPSVDTSAAWGRRRSKRPNAGREPDEYYFGWQEQIMTMVNDEGGSKVPELVRRATLAAANVPPAPASLEMLARYRDDGGEAGDLLADAAYPYADDWMTTVLALKFQPVVDLHPNLLGRKGTEQGAFVVDDQLVCPMTPPELIDLPRPASNASPEDWDDYFERRAERDKFAFKTHGRADGEGDQRMKCPAECGTVRCPAKPTSMSNPIDRPKIFDPPDPAPRCCTQRTITISRDVGGKARQKHPYWSKEWHASYDRRSAVERSFSWVKDKARLDLNRGAIRVMGLAKNRLMRTIAWMAVNYKILSNFEAWRAEPERRRRKPRGRKQFTEALTNIRPATSPPPRSNSPPAL